MFITYVLLTDKDVPFYVGAGGDMRISQHMTMRGGRPKVNEIIAEHRSRGSDIKHQIVKVFDNKSEAFELEEQLIGLFGKVSDGGLLVNITDGGEGVKGLKHSETVKIQSSKRMIDHFKDPVERLKTSKLTRIGMKDKTVRENISSKLKDKWKDSEFRSKQITSHTGIKDSDETKFRKSKSCSEAWSNGKRKGKYTDEQVLDVYSRKGNEKADTVALIYNMNPTYVHKIWRHERCRMALARLGII